MKNNPRNQFNIHSLLKPLGLLFLIVILFSLLSHYLYGSRQTLRQYADSRTQDTEEQIDESPLASPLETSEESLPDNIPEDAESPSDTDSSMPPEENPLRTVYAENFYYEPLSEEIKMYITGISYPEDGAEEISYEDLNYVHVLHYNFDGEVTEGELICNQAIAQDLVEIFYDLYIAEYQIERIALIDVYEGDDNASMADNNTSCFNYRPVTGQTNLSRHGLGLAIDINPFYNPYIRYLKEGGQIVLPEGSESYTDRSAAFPYKIDTEDLCYRLFIEHGFTWGGNWNSMKDYQHFQKVID